MNNREAMVAELTVLKEQIEDEIEVLKEDIAMIRLLANGFTLEMHHTDADRDDYSLIIRKLNRLKDELKDKQTSLDTIVKRMEELD